MSPKGMALLQARVRIAIGAALLAVPKLAGRSWIGGDASGKPTTVFARGLGGRDMALGLGVVIALDRGAPVRGWLEACALADLADFVATVLARESIPPRAAGGAMVIAGGSAILCGVLSHALDQPPIASEGQTPEAVLTGHPA